MRTLLPRLCVATGNAGKLREFEALLAGFALEIVPQSALGIAPIDETGSSFEANALLKARHAAGRSGCAALADDSGLEVDALEGAPGVYSARYAGVGATDADNNAKLLVALAGVAEPRTARYRAVLALVRSAGDPAPLVAHGSWEGRIARVPCGSGGFGYDPLFLVGDTAHTAAELDAAHKNRISHRALALAALGARLDSL